VKSTVLILTLKFFCTLTVVTPCIGLLLGILGAMTQNASLWSGEHNQLGLIFINIGKYLLWSALFILMITMAAWILTRLYFKEAKHKLPQIGKVFISTFLVWLAVGIFAPQIHSQGVLACHFKLKKLHLALQQYAQADPNNRYPVPEKWCDLLMEKTNLNPDAFRCPRDGKGPCSYAINPDARFDSAKDVVLLFETDPGWNQHGRQELLRLKNHNDITGKAVNLVTNDGRTLRTCPEEFAELKWQDKTMKD
jgi:hypothetical protein